jgi:hypothetical protein
MGVRVAVLLPIDGQGLPFNTDAMLEPLDAVVARSQPGSNGLYGQRPKRLPRSPRIHERPRGLLLRSITTVKGHKNGFSLMT